VQGSSLGIILNIGAEKPPLRKAGNCVCLESLRENGKNAVQKMEAFCILTADIKVFEDEYKREIKFNLGARLHQSIT